MKDPDLSSRHHPLTSIVDRTDQRGKFKTRLVRIRCRSCGAIGDTQFVSYFDRTHGYNYHAKIMRPLTWEFLYIEWKNHKIKAVAFCENCRPSDLYEQS